MSALLSVEVSQGSILENFTAFGAFDALYMPKVSFQSSNTHL